MNKIVLILTIVLFYSCKNQNAKFINYENSYNGFDKNLINHFPTNDDSVISYSLFRNLKPQNNWLTSFDVGRLFLKVNVKKDSEIWKETLRFCNEKSIKKIESNSNSDIFIPLKFKDSLYSKEHKKKKEYFEYKNSFVNKNYSVIPNFNYTFEFIGKSLTEFGLPREFSTYIIESKKGVFTDNNDFLMENSELYFPSDLLHGVSKGISLNESDNEIIYWVVYW